VVFGAEFIEEFKTFNDRKSRKDHETQNTRKAFWIRATFAYNSCVACDTVSFETTTPIAQRDQARRFLTPPVGMISTEVLAGAASTENGHLEILDNESPQQQVQTSFSSLICLPDDVIVHMISSSAGTDM
jgi:hypothetical protein